MSGGRIIGIEIESRRKMPTAQPIFQSVYSTSIKRNGLRLGEGLGHRHLRHSLRSPLYSVGTIDSNVALLNYSIG